MKRILIAIAILSAGTANAATIYLCKAYSGSTFWASKTCSTYNALIDRMESVADVPWDQQVQQAEQGRLARASQQQATAQAQQPSRCPQLIAERNKIESRYSNWQWQPPEVINPDQQRMRALRSELAANRCQSQ